MKIAVFDLNKTLYRRSSKSEFFKFVCFKRSYKIGHLLELMFLALAGKLRLINITSFKENFFNYLDDLEPATVTKYAEQFWAIEYPDHFNDEVLHRMKKHREEGMKIYLITGGLEIYTKPITDHIKFDGFLGTQTEYTNGTYKIIGDACKGEEKVRRLEEDLKGQPFEIAVAYSDEKEAILDQATKAYFIHEGKIKPYDPTNI
jgi:HAD superfamily phosphoserine phosphatase-like hydrolase